MTNEKALYLLEHGDWFQAVYNNLPESTAEQIAEAINTVAKTVRFTFYGDPLTLEQLRNMDGKPVWIVESPDWGHWELSEDAEDYILDRDTDLYGLTYPDPDGKAGLHKLGWIAYAYPPSHIDREAWTAEWVKHDGYTECSKCEHWYDSPENEDEGDQPAFCPSCGRAMTPEAWAELERRISRKEEQ